MVKPNKNKIKTKKNKIKKEEKGPRIAQQSKEPTKEGAWRNRKGGAVSDLGEAHLLGGIL